MIHKTGKYIISAAFCLAFLFIAGKTLTVNAASGFDAAFYAASYPDVAAVFGNDSQALLNHYLTYGIKEGRLPYAGAQPGAAVEYGEANASADFDAAFYAAAYPDVAAVFGNDPQALLNHYLTYGIKEGRLPNAGTGQISVQQTGTPQETAGFTPVPVNRLANLKSLRKKMNDAELNQAYNAALQVVAPYAGLSQEEQLIGVASSLREMFDSGMSYSMSTPHYNDPYGYFVLHTASCAGCTRATGLCLNILGMPYEHVNENQYTHQWCRVNLNGTYWICDAYGLYCGPEPAPYMHPYF